MPHLLTSVCTSLSFAKLASSGGNELVPRLSDTSSFTFGQTELRIIVGLCCCINGTTAPPAAATITLT
ncbi:hypothetical protein M5D96_001858 [Drosophila gunungcola]|uniref:Uncharacterized protein n=1 Tax=Drosophila gunungcola TaxID=103775 RepID=A0A9P9YZA2_9MUSC|nr:hypothetical protein M5D96_001858 [Drosophila gunungcola]